jgi:signal transduction histidine kinase
LLNKFARELKRELKLQKVEVLFCEEVCSVYHSNSRHQTSRHNLAKHSQKGSGSDTPTQHGFAPNSEYHQIIKFFSKHQEIKVTEEEERKVGDLKPSKYRTQLDNTAKALAQKDIAVVAPVSIKKNHKITALIFLGDKSSGDIFDNRDIRLLELLRGQLASALEKSGLYEEVKAFAGELKKKVEERTLQLREANTQLRHLDKAKTLFLSIASHQLRTPLTGIRGFLSMILQGDFGTGLPAKVREILEEVYANTTHLIRLVSTFLNVSRIEAGHLSLMKVEYDLIPMAQKTVNELKFEAQSKGLKLSFECKEKKVIANIDADKIEDVLVNLTDNAIKYTDKGWVRVRLIDRGAKVRFEVEDTGQGLNQEEIKTLFNKFVRGDRAPKLHTDGSGLGLFIAKRIVEMHKGHIGVTSPGVGKGSLFWFEVPK